MSPTDRRVRRTRTALREALIALIAERDFADITVQDITDRADVGRSTFYAHYADKEDLLGESLSELGAFARGGAEATPLGFALPLFHHVHEVRPMFAALLGRSGPPQVQEAFLEAVRELLREHEGDEARVCFVAAGFLALARWWVLEAPQLGPEQVYARFLELAGGGEGASPTHQEAAP